MATQRGFQVSIRDINSGTHKLIAVYPDMRVIDVKNLFSEASGIPLHSFRLVFAGRPLNDHDTLAGFGLQSYSTLHCISGQLSITTEQVSPARDVRQLEYRLGSMEMSNGGVPPQTPPGPGKNVNRFFVFCKKCNDTQPGKLRVRCDNCKDEGFVLRGDPQEWNDVLTKRKLRGTCYKGSCGGDQHAEFFFKCANHQTALQSLAQTEEKCVALHMLRVNAVGMDCPLCYDVKDVMVVFNCDNRDGHSLCLECFVSYATLELNERRFIEHRECGYTIQCPSRCTNSFVTEIHHFYLLGKELYEKYQKFGAEECLLQMGGILCPSPDCGCGMLPENNGRSLTCPECRFNFCRECKAEYHRGPCNVAAPLNNQAVGQGQQIDPARLNRSRWDEATRNFIQSNDMIKQCPNCQTYIEKNRGCMHMTCTRCHFEFCWLCMTQWGRNCMDAHWFG